MSEVHNLKYTVAVCTDASWDHKLGRKLQFCADSDLMLTPRLQSQLVTLNFPQKSMTSPIPPIALKRKTTEIDFCWVALAGHCKGEVRCVLWLWAHLISFHQLACWGGFYWSLQREKLSSWRTQVALLVNYRHHTLSQREGFQQKCHEKYGLSSTGLLGSFSLSFGRWELEFREDLSCSIVYYRHHTTVNGKGSQKKVRKNMFFHQLAC